MINHVELVGFTFKAWPGEQKVGGCYIDSRRGGKLFGIAVLANS